MSSQFEIHKGEWETEIEAVFERLKKVSAKFFFFLVDCLRQE